MRAERAADTILRVHQCGDRSYLVVDQFSICHDPGRAGFDASATGNTTLGGYDWFEPQGTFDPPYSISLFVAHSFHRANAPTGGTVNADSRVDGVQLSARAGDGGNGAYFNTGSTTSAQCSYGMAQTIPPTGFGAINPVNPKPLMVSIFGTPVFSSQPISFQ